MSRNVLCWVVAVGMLSTGLWVGGVEPAAGGNLAAPKDWPQWRGPNRDGISTETGLLREWTTEPTLLWKKSGLGRGYTSVAIVDGVIYTAGKRKDKSFAIALDEADGTEKWATQIGKDKDENPRGSPTVDGDRVYYIGAEGALVCLKRADGAVMWSKDLAKEYGARVMSGWKFCESPLIDGDRLICTPGSGEATLVCLNKLSGDTIWKCVAERIGDRGGDGAGYSSVVISHGAGVKQYVQLLGRGLIGVRAEDGKYLWGYNRVANGTANIPTPIPDGDFVFCSSGYGTGAGLVKLSRDGEGVKADEVYFLGGKEFQNHHGGMIKIGPHIYAGHGNNQGFPTCVEMATGKVVWQHLERNEPGSGSAAIVYAEDRLYFRYQDGTMALLDASPEGFKLRGKFKIPGAGGDSWAHPVVLHGKLFLREHDNLFVYDIARKDGN